MEMSDQPIIELRCLSFHYPDGRQALDQVSIQVMPGEKISLLGSNGAGKSTLLLHLNGILQGDGDVRILGMDAKSKQNAPVIRSKVGLVFQNPDDQLFSPTVYEDVAYGLVYQGLARDQIHTRVQQALAMVGMPGSSDRPPLHLSGGEKKRVALASVLCLQPDVLVLDEPTAGLDPRGRREMIEFLRTFHQTLLLATHDLGLAAALTSRAIVMNHGSVAVDMPINEVLANQQILLENGLC
jgi:cobalt/nickel transport system ATP-binding protein